MLILKPPQDQIFNLNQSMKESFAVERSECLDRMDRRALRERIAIERQQAVRDVSLKRDLASWLEKKLRDVNKVQILNGGGTKIEMPREKKLRDFYKDIDYIYLGGRS